MDRCLGRWRRRGLCRLVSFFFVTEDVVCVFSLGGEDISYVPRSSKGCRMDDKGCLYTIP